MSEPTDSSPDSSPDSSYDLAPVKPPPPPEPAAEEPPARAPAPVAAPALPGAAAAPLPEKACPHCGFRVVGRPRNNRCPECGAQLNEAAADLLQFAPGAWTRTVAIGPLVLMIAILGHVAAVFRAYGFLHFGQPYPLHAAAAALTILGVWLLTLQDPHLQSRRLHTVWTARTLSLVLLLFWILLAAHRQQDPDVRETRVDLLFFLAQATLAALAFIVCGYARNLALRIPNDSVAHHFYLLSYLMFPFLLVAMFGHFFDLERFIIAFFCSFPAIAVLGAIALWLMISFLRLSLDMYVAAATGQSIKERRERTIAAQKKPPR